MTSFNLPATIATKNFFSSIEDGSVNMICGTRIFQLTWDGEKDVYVVTLRNLVAEHLTQGGYTLDSLKWRVEEIAKTFEIDPATIWELFAPWMEDEFVLDMIKSFGEWGHVGINKIPNIIEHTMGYCFTNNNPHLIKFEWLGKVYMLSTKNTTTYTIEYALLEEHQYDAKKKELEAQAAYKKRYDEVPSDVVLKHKYLRMQDNPDKFPKATGKGVLEGCTDMGSCQCGNVLWTIEYNCDTLEFTHSNSNWANHSDHHIPYVGNALEVICNATNILSGWKYVDNLD